MEETTKVKKKKYELGQQQGMTTGGTFEMPQTALIDPNAQNALGFTPTSFTNVTPGQVPPPEPIPEPKPKGNSGGSFKRSDFPPGEEGDYQYEQAKRRAGLSTDVDPYHEKLQAEQALVAQQQQAQQELQQLGMVAGVSQAELNGIVEQYGLSAQAQRKEGFAGAMREGIPSALQSGVTAGLGAALIGAVGTGATAGAIGGPVGIAIGASAGIVFGLWKGLRAARKAEAKEDVTNAMNEFTQLKKGMTQVTSLATSGYINANEAVELYNAQLTRMLQIEAQIKYLQDTNLKDYLSDGSDDLATIQTYLNQVAPAYAMRIRSAMMNPMAKVPYSDIIMEDLQNADE